MSAAVGQPKTPDPRDPGEGEVMSKTPYLQSITPQSLLCIDAIDLTFGTTKLLPPEEDIPQEFIRGNVYTSLVEGFFFGKIRSDLEITFRDDFDPKLAVQAVRAHLASWEPKHQHKIAGVGYLLSLMATVSEPEQAASGADETKTI